MTIDKSFIDKYLLSGNGNLNARALEKYNISKDRAYQIYHGMPGPAQCKECSSPTKFISFNKGYALFCSKSCMVKNPDVLAAKRATLISNFGSAGFRSDEIKNKKKSTSLLNYGVEYPRQNRQFVESLQEKFLNTYGTRNPATTDSANKKRAETNLRKYGTENPASSLEVRSKIENTNRERYGVKTTLMLSENRDKSLTSRKDADVYAKLDDPLWLEAHKAIPSTLLSEQLGVAWSTILNYFKKHNIIRSSTIVSSYELKLINLLKEQNISYIANDRTVLDGKEIDIYLPDYNTGIEIDGLYWHSDQYIRDKFYHFNKTELARKKGIHLIHITDSEINNRFEIVKNRILAKLNKQCRIFARKCKIVPVSSAEYDSFMETNHIQGTAPASVRIGLTFNNNLVAVMSFSRARYNKNYEWELIRYATTVSVVGGATKLFSYFIKTFSPNSIISYSDIRWNTGEVYSKIGMKFSHISAPNYWYIINGELSHRTKFQKHKLKSILDKYDDSLSEWENMKSNGYNRYWDCGNKVFTWNNLNDKNKENSN